MLYLTSIKPDCIYLQKYYIFSLRQQIADANRYRGSLTSFLDEDTVEVFSKKFNVGLPSFTPALDFQTHVDAVENIADILAPFDRVIVLLSGLHTNKTLVSPAYLRWYEIWSGYYDQPLLDCMGYEYQDQVSIENALIQRLRFESGQRNPEDIVGSASGFISRVSQALERLVVADIVEIENQTKRYDYWRRENRYRLTGESLDGIITPVFCKSEYNKEQLTLFSTKERDVDYLPYIGTRMRRLREFSSVMEGSMPNSEITQK